MAGLFIMKQTKPDTIVYVIDPLVSDKKYGLERQDAEGVLLPTFNEIYKSLKSYCANVIVCDDLNEFTKAIIDNPNSVVFSTRYGLAFPGSKAYVPAICEANNVLFVGPDSYTQMLCNDKWLTKSYIKKFGLKTANAVLIHNPKNEWELSTIKTLQLPVVVKPNYGGGSNGISISNLKNTHLEAMHLAKTLGMLQNNAILVEEYVEGYEVELIIYGSKSQINICEEIQLKFNNETYYHNVIWGYESKKIEDEVEYAYSSYLSAEDKQKCIDIFKSFNKIEYTRFDFRICNEGAYLIELSPDCYLGSDGGVFKAFEKNGISFVEMISSMIENAIAHDVRVSPKAK